MPNIGGKMDETSSYESKKQNKIELGIEAAEEKWWMDIGMVRFPNAVAPPFVTGKYTTLDSQKSVGSYSHKRIVMVCTNR